MTARGAGGAWLPAGVSVLLVAALGALYWVGYQGADDGSYVDAAVAWLRDGPAVGDSHWSVRYPIILTVAGSMALLGERTLALGLPFLLALLGTALITVRLMTRRLGTREATLFALLFLTMPGSIVLASFASDDVLELFLVVVSVALYLGATDAGGARRLALLLGAGLFAGLAFLGRETTAGLVLAYGVLFLVRPGLPRLGFVAIGAGFCAVVLGESAFHWIAVGDPLYRWRLDSTHDVVDRAAEAARTAAAGNVLDREGNLSLGVALTPLLMFLVSQKYGLAFYLGALGTVPLLRGRVRGARARTVLIVALAVGACWCAFIVGAQRYLFLVPRYLLVGAWAACVLGGARLGAWWRDGRRALAGTLLAAALAANAVCLSVENDDPIQASKAALSVAAAASEPVWTDPLTARRGRFLRDAAGLGDRLRAGPPPAGALFAYAPDDVARCAGSPECNFTAAPYTPGPGWAEVERRVPPPRPVFAALLRWLALPIPPQLERKIVQPNAGVIVYRTGRGES
jgi:4-amino-4-deoxy-L-arabinose transferase-like glycosyltransferase